MLSQADTLFRPSVEDLKKLPSYISTSQEVKDIVSESAKDPIQKIIKYLEDAMEEKKQNIADQLMKEVNGFMQYSSTYSLHPQDANNQYNRAIISAVRDHLIPHLTPTMATATRKGEMPYLMPKFAKHLLEIFGEDYINAFVLRSAAKASNLPLQPTENIGISHGK